MNAVGAGWELSRHDRSLHGDFPELPVPDVGIPRELARELSMPEQYEYLRTRLTRRRALVAASAFAGGGLAAGCAQGSEAPARVTSGSSPNPATSRIPGAAVTPFGRHLAFGADPKTQMRISWQVPFAVRKPYIRVGPTPGP